jgi:hypothetical protein
MVDERAETDPEVLVVAIWPGLRALGYRTKSAAHDAVRRGVIPEEALVRLGGLTRVSKGWIARKAAGEPASAPTPSVVGHSGAPPIAAKRTGRPQKRPRVAQREPASPAAPIAASPPGDDG